jgi:hypothetical protein
VRITAAITGQAITFAGGVAKVTASATGVRTIGGVVLKYGTYGLTSKGRLKVAPGALRWPADLGVVKLTREHDREDVRGYLVAVQDDGGQVRVTAQISDGPEGDEAVREARGRLREGLSFDIVDATIVADTITAGRVVAIGQVGVPAYDDGRIDQIAANLNNEGNPMLTPEQLARLAALAAQTTRNDEEEAEFQALIKVIVGDTPGGGDAPAEGEEVSAALQAAIAAAVQGASDGHQIAASLSAIASGVPRPESRPPARTEKPKGQAFAEFVATFTDALRTKAAGGGGEAITAALQDVVHSTHTANIEQPAWSGELWSGLLYESEWSDLFTQGTLTNWEGAGWRFTSKLEIQDYAGNKAAIPSDNVTTEPSSYEAARMAVGVDVDRKFYDFPNEGFVQSLWEQVRESWAIKLDGKVRAYTLANAVTAKNDEADPASLAYPASASLLKAAAVVVRALKRRRVGKASWVYVNDEDLFTLLDIDEKSLPAFLDLWGIDPRNFRSSETVPEGTVMAGVSQAATVRVLPGSPVKVDAQHIANGGVDTGFFGYWAVEEHHTSGIAKTSFVPN